MPWIFNYAELGPQEVEALLKKAPFCALPASAENFQVVFKGKSRKWGGGIATLEKKKSGVVYGSALLVSADEVKLFDKYFSSHTRTPITISLDATKDKIKAFTYVIEKDATTTAPSTEYSKAVVKHLKFFWGGQAKNPTLQDFGINLSGSSEKISSAKEETPPAGSIEELIQTPSKRGRKKKEAAN